MNIDLYSYLKKYWVLLAVVCMRCIELIATIIAMFTVPYLGFFSYGAVIREHSNLPLVQALANFDGIFYIRIALNGYSLTEQAYFPLYPILLYNVSTLVGNPIIAGALISYISFFLGVWVFYKYMQLILAPNRVFWALLFLITYPTAYYFGVLYTESLFFVLLAGFLFSLKKKWYVWASVLAFCAALTKVIGIFLALIIVGILLEKLWSVHAKKWLDYVIETMRQWPLVLVGIASPLGLMSYCFYLWKTTGDALLFIHAQESFGAHRSSSLITPAQVLYRYLKIFMTADFNFQYAISMVEVIFFLFSLIVVVYELWNISQEFIKRKIFDGIRLGMGLFSLAIILVPSLTGTLTAMPRYTMMAVTIYLVLSEIHSVKYKRAILGIFIALHIIFCALFVQGYYVT